MHVHINHMFCTRSNWDGGAYLSRYMVGIKEKLARGHKAPIEKDWINLLEEHEFFDQEEFERLKAWNKKEGKDIEEKTLEGMCDVDTIRLKPEVFKWLEKNVADNPKEKDNGGGKGFCVGNDSYNSRTDGDFNIFFYRRSDALKFIKRWSSHKKPTTYFDYFKEIRKELNFKTNTLQPVEEFTML